MFQRSRKTKPQVSSPRTLAEIQEIAARKFDADDRKRAATKESDSHRAVLLDYAARHGTPTGGHRDVTFPDGGGFRRQLSESTYLDEPAAFDLLEERGVTDQATDTITIRQINQDKLYALQQRGVITREELASLFVRERTYSLRRL